VYSETTTHSELLEQRELLRLCVLNTRKQLYRDAKFKYFESLRCIVALSRVFYHVYVDVVSDTAVRFDM
jgi:hypothetical protein